jgi:hypothetical protein
MFELVWWAFLIRISHHVPDDYSTKYAQIQSYSEVIYLWSTPKYAQIQSYSEVIYLSTPSF